ncbi:MAG: copper chaperone PCu(A)C [Wenzhouxiangella sp.]|nr:MAG: copper chaperone PCu(A)C [Wenzhouxiangella sp.]
MPRTLIALLLVLTVVATALAEENQLQFENVWTPEAPPGRMMAGFMEIHNPGNTSVAIVDARADGFGYVELHNTTMDDGVMRMRRIDSLDIAPGQTLVLEPGGLHVMLIEPIQQFTAGDRISLVLIDSDGREYSAPSEVRPRRRQ